MCLITWIYFTVQDFHIKVMLLTNFDPEFYMTEYIKYGAIVMKSPLITVQQFLSEI
jgi:hypothetical protein